MWGIKLTLEGNMTHVLNDVRSGNPGWSDCNPSGILKIEFPFIGKNGTGKDIPYLLLMSGMKEYNFFVEAVKGLSSNSKVNIKGLWFMGKLPNSNRVTGFVLKESVLVLNTEVGKEYQGFSTVGWKTGIIGGKVVSTVIRRA
jgi:hypothetical protein